MLSCFINSLSHTVHWIRTKFESLSFMNLNLQSINHFVVTAIYDIGHTTHDFLNLLLTILTLKINNMVYQQIFQQIWNDCSLSKLIFKKLCLVDKSGALKM